MEQLLVTFAHAKHINFLELVFKLICFYYNFNITYPKEISLSMEFFVMFLLKYYSQTFRGRKKNVSNVSKVSNLIKYITKCN